MSEMRLRMAPNAHQQFPDHIPDHLTGNAGVHLVDCLFKPFLQSATRVQVHHP